eukprot:Tbor_TRINITY_DN5331_c2_g6::TRINITY_DN5331_c2_g6_i1::g.4738::m.4738/K02977/RP-S27Ae, RPS27A; small subunit ribosomal protein S27Ae
MQLFIKTAAGPTELITAAADQTISSIKSQLSLTGNLFYSGELLLDDNNNNNNNTGLLLSSLPDHATLHECNPLLGGKGKKKKKRVFTKPKKNAHRHKLETMRVLKYYTVSGDGENEEFTIKRNLTECRHPQCGPGVFMAKHKDGRQTCGKCSMTFKP